MANVEVRLKVSGEAYQAKIDLLEGYLIKIDSTLQSYEQKKIELDSFMGGGDDNYEDLKESIENNIKTVRKAREMTEQSLTMLKKTLDDMVGLSGKIGGAVTAGLQAGMTAMKTAIDAMNLVD